MTTEGHAAHQPIGSFGRRFTMATTCTHARPFNGPFSGTTRVSRYQKGKTNLDFTEARDSEWQWHQLGHMQVCTSLQTDNHASTNYTTRSFLQAGCPSCRPTNSVKALKTKCHKGHHTHTHTTRKQIRSHRYIVITTKRPLENDLNV